MYGLIEGSVGTNETDIVKEEVENDYKDNNNEPSNNSRKNSRNNLHMTPNNTARHHSSVSSVHRNSIEGPDSSDYENFFIIDGSTDSISKEEAAYNYMRWYYIQMIRYSSFERYIVVCVYVCICKYKYLFVYLCI